MSAWEIRIFEIISVLTILVMLVIMTRLFRGIRMVNARVTLLSHLVKEARAKLEIVPVSDQEKSLMKEIEADKQKKAVNSDIAKDKAEPPKEPPKEAPTKETEQKPPEQANAETKSPFFTRKPAPKAVTYVQVTKPEDIYKIDLSKFEELSDQLEKEFK